MFKHAILLAAVAGLVLALAGSAQAGLTGPGGIVAPTGLSEGDKYHLVFVSSGNTKATSDQISFFDTFVNTAADASGLPGVPDVTWYAIATTSTSADAKDLFSDASPIYLLDGTTKVKDSYAQMWPEDETQYGSYLDARITVDENGDTVELIGSPNNEDLYVWTGTKYDGTAHGLWLDTTGEARCGKMYAETPGEWEGDWIDGIPREQGEDGFSKRVYGISEELTVIPEPATLTLLGLGGLGLILSRKRK